MPFLRLVPNFIILSVRCYLAQTSSIMAKRLVVAAMLLCLAAGALASSQSSRIEVYRLWQAEKSSGLKFGAQKTSLNLVVATPASQSASLSKHLVVVPIEQLTVSSLDDVRLSSLTVFSEDMFCLF